MSNAVFPRSDTSGTQSVWWREPYVWLVVGGPLLVVVAAVFTIFIAVKNPDPVLDSKQMTATRLLEMARHEQAEKDKLVNLQPAMLGRNHAASPLPLEVAPAK